VSANDTDIELVNDAPLGVIVGVPTLDVAVALAVDRVDAPLDVFVVDFDDATVGLSA
jgi:hypothetical protein